MPQDYAPHEDFIRPARGEPSLRYVFSVAVICVVTFMLSPVLIYILLPSPLNDDIFEMTTPLGTLLSFGTFGITAYVVVKTIRFFHRRGFWSLIGPYRTALADIRKVAIAVVANQFFVQIVLPFGSWGDVAEVRPIALWLALVPLSLSVIFIQVSTEELVFRGYLQQQLACVSQSRWVWMFLPSIAFGTIHYWNGNSAPEGFVYAFWAGLLGVACADLTARTGSLGAAIGLHFGVNVVAIMFVGIQDWPFSGLALVLITYFDPDVLSAEIIAEGMTWVILSMIMSAVSVLIVWLVARITIRR
ncbi:type II CAAX endopeptidase family protein [Yoonia sp. GPGPB17]|uniref:CPBP family intramembrane glutamic endopeptidase n=1 Tax=Yoonia sp. GPGPB17 TaxID=3026147 RepID=UPI0030C03F3C